MHKLYIALVWHAKSLLKYAPLVIEDKTFSI